LSAGSQTTSDMDAPLVPDAALWRAPWEFGVHAAIGTVIFVIIAAFALIPHLAVREIETYGGGRGIVLALDAGEYALLACDLILFCVFLWRATKRMSKRL
jgi:hypothetical protein